MLVTVFRCDRLISFLFVGIALLLPLRPRGRTSDRLYRFEIEPQPLWAGHGCRGAHTGRVQSRGDRHAGANDIRGAIESTLKLSSYSEVSGETSSPDTPRTF